MRSGCSTGSLTSKRRTRNGLPGFASGREIRFSGCRRSFLANAKTGVLDEGPGAEERFAEFANDEPCPVLDPETGLCDLYDARPMTCRTFGPPVRSDGGLGVCELCFHGATDEQIAGCEMVVDPDDLESKLLRKLEKTQGPRGRTIVAFCVK